MLWFFFVGWHGSAISRKTEIKIKFFYSFLLVLLCLKVGSYVPIELETKDAQLDRQTEQAAAAIATAQQNDGSQVKKES